MKESGERLADKIIGTAKAKDKIAFLLEQSLEPWRPELGS